MGPCGASLLHRPAPGPGLGVASCCLGNTSHSAAEPWHPEKAPAPRNGERGSSGPASPNLFPAPGGSPPGSLPTLGWGACAWRPGGLSITSRSSSLGRAALSTFSSLLSMRFTSESWKLATLNRRARVPKYSVCWDFSTSLYSWKDGHHICRVRVKERVRVSQ